MDRSRSEVHAMMKKIRERKRKQRIKGAWIGAAVIAACGAIWLSWPLLNPGAGGTGKTPAALDNKPSVTVSPNPSAVKPNVTGGTASPNQSGSAATAAPTPSAPAGERVKLAFTGDVIMAETVEGVMRQNGFDYPYKLVKPFLERADLTIANLETPITTRGTKQDKQYAYRSTPQALPAFKEAGFNLVNMANNHSMDMGTEGLLDTFDYLDKAGISRFGAGKNRAEAYKPVIVEKNGMTIAFLGFTRVIPDVSWYAGDKTPGLAATYDHVLPQALEAIKSARSQADLVVVVTHWGVERNDLPEKYQRDLAKAYIDAGADLIVGGHPHVLQGFESYKGKWILYSLGNFVFTTNDVEKTWQTIILEASCTKDRQCDVRAVPVLTKWAQPAPLEGAEASALLTRLSSISYGASVGEDGAVVLSPGKEPAPTQAPPSASAKPGKPASPTPKATPKPTPKETPKATPKSSPTQKSAP